MAYAKIGDFEAEWEDDHEFEQVRMMLEGFKKTLDQFNPPKERKKKIVDELEK